MMKINKILLLTFGIILIHLNVFGAATNFALNTTSVALDNNEGCTPTTYTIKQKIEKNGIIKF